MSRLSSDVSSPHGGGSLCHLTLVCSLAALCAVPVEEVVADGPRVVFSKMSGRPQWAVLYGNGAATGTSVGAAPCVK